MSRQDKIPAENVGLATKLMKAGVTFLALQSGGAAATIIRQPGPREIGLRPNGTSSSNLGGQLAEVPRLDSQRLQDLNDTDAGFGRVESRKLLADTGPNSHLTLMPQQSSGANNMWKTYVVNRSTVDIKATTSFDCFSLYFCEPHSLFQDRLIKAGAQDHDEYCKDTIQSPPQTPPVPAWQGEPAKNPDIDKNQEACSGKDNKGNGLGPEVLVQLKLATAKNHGSFRIWADDSISVTDAADGDGYDVHKVKYGTLSVDDVFMGKIFNN